MRMNNYLSFFLASLFFTIGCVSIPMENEGSRTIFTSKHNNERGVINKVDLNKMAKGAPLRVVAMVHTKLQPSEAWKAGLADINKWSGGQVTNVSFHDGKWNGKKVDWQNVSNGTYRQCLNNKNGDLLVEKIRYIDHDKKMYVYSLDPSLSTVFVPISNHTGAVTIEPDGKGGSLLTFRAYFDKNWNPMSWISPPLFRGQFNQYMNDFAKVYGGTVVNAKFHQ